MFSSLAVVIIWYSWLLLVQGEQFAVEEVEVVVATVDLDEVVSWRGKNSSQREQASAAPRCICLLVFCRGALSRKRSPGTAGLSGDCSMYAEATHALETLSGAGAKGRAAIIQCEWRLQPPDTCVQHPACGRGLRAVLAGRHCSAALASPGAFLLPPGGGDRLRPGRLAVGLPQTQASTQQLAHV